MQLRVAHLTTVDSSLLYLLLPQLTAVLEEGWEVIGVSAPGPCVPVLEAHGVRHVTLGGSTRGVDPRGDAQAARNLFAILRRERVDVLHTHNPKPGLYGRIVGRLAGVPIVVNTVHGLYATPDDRWRKRAAVYGLEAVASRLSDAELVQNPEDLDTMRRWHVAPRAHLRLLGNGVDLRRFDPSRDDLPSRDAIRAGLGIQPGQVVVGTVARLVEEKGYLELFEAMAGMDGAVLVVVGPDDPEKDDRLPRAVIDRARAQGAKFLGLRDDVDALYRAFDVFVLASHREGFPRAAMEAAAMRLPIVATDVRGCRQVVDDGVSGLLVPVRDAPALRAAIEQLVTDASLRDRFGVAARERAIAHFDERRVVEIVMSTYRELAVRKGLASS